MTQFFENIVDPTGRPMFTSKFDKSGVDSGNSNVLFNYDSRMVDIIGGPYTINGGTLLSPGEYILCQDKTGSYSNNLYAYNLNTGTFTTLFTKVEYDAYFNPALNDKYQAHLYNNKLVIFGYNHAFDQKINFYSNTGLSTIDTSITTTTSSYNFTICSKGILVAQNLNSSPAIVRLITESSNTIIYSKSLSASSISIAPVSSYSNIVFVNLDYSYSGYKNITSKLTINTSSVDIIDSIPYSPSVSSNPYLSVISENEVLLCGTTGIYKVEEISGSLDTTKIASGFPSGYSYTSTPIYKTSTGEYWGWFSDRLSTIEFSGYSSPISEDILILTTSNSALSTYNLRKNSIIKTLVLYKTALGKLGKLWV